VASRLRLRFHLDDVRSGSVMFYASTHGDALGVVTLIISTLKLILIVSVHILCNFVLIQLIYKSTSAKRKYKYLDISFKYIS
jgi:hypothetical protein